MTTANKVTVFRVLLVPFFVVELVNYLHTGKEAHRIAALAAFFSASILDGVDGFIARHFHQVSELGKFLDPLADKLLLVSAIVSLGFNHGPHLSLIPIWFTGAVLGRDLLLLIGLGVIHFTMGKVNISPCLVGKAATVLQMTLVLFILLKWDTHFPSVLFFLALTASIFTGISGLIYLWDGMRVLGSHPSSSPTNPAPPPDK